MSNPPTTVAPIISTDLPCKTCGYNLRTRSTADTCPECATPVADSIEFARNGRRNPARTRGGALLLALAALMGIFNQWPAFLANLQQHLGLDFGSMPQISVRVLLDLALIAGVYQLASSRPAGNSKWTLSGIACLLLVAAHVVLDATTGSPGLWTLFAKPGSPAAFRWFIKLNTLLLAADMLLLLAGALFIRRFARQFKYPRLSQSAFVCYGMMLLLTLLQTVTAGSTSLLPGRLQGSGIVLIAALHLPLQLQIPLRIIALLAITGLWIAVALIASGFGPSSASPAPPPPDPLPPSPPDFRS